MPGLTNKSNQALNPKGANKKIYRLAATKGLGKKRDQNNKAVNNIIAHSSFVQFVSGNNVEELLKDKIEETDKLCSSKVKNHVVEIAKNKMGFYGGMKYKGNIKANPAGYDLRRFLKERTRTWANEQVESERIKYATEKHKEIDNEKISRQEKQQKKSEFDKTQYVKTNFLRADLYKTLKSDVVNRIDKECIDLATEIDAKYLPLYDGLVREAVRDMFSSEFQSSHAQGKEKNEGISTSDLELLAKNSAMKKVETSTNTISAQVFNSIKSALDKDSEAFIAKKRSEVSNKFGGKEEGKRTSFEGVKADDYSSVENYVYEKDDNKAKTSGVKSLNEMKESISVKVRSNDALTNDANRGFRYLSKVAFSLVHNNGDTASLETSFKIPVSPGVFFNVKVTGGVEKDDDHVTAKVNLGVGASGEVGIAKLAGEVGGYMELKAKTPEDMAKLLSYTMYRQFRESKVIPTAITNKIWGMGGISGKSKYEEAEAFGANMETALFGKDVKAENSSKVGGYGKFSGEVQATDTVGINFEVKGGAARDYSKKSFEATKQTDRIGKMEAYKFGGRSSKGQITGNFSVSFEVGAFIGGGSAALEMKFRSGKVESITVKMGGKLKFSGSDLSNEKIKETVAMAVNSASSFINSVVKGGINIGNMAKNKNASGTEISQMIMGDGGQVAFQAFQTGFTGPHLNDILSQFNDNSKLMGGPQFSNVSEGSLGLELAYEWKPGTKGNFSVSLTTTSSAGVNFGVASVKAERAQRLIKWATGADGNTALDKFKGGFSYI